MAIGGPWHAPRNGRLKTGLMNSAQKVRAYSEALAKKGIEPWVWGYPWQGTEAKFAQQMAECAGDFKLGLLDPELGSNPSRSARQMAKANEHARLVVLHMKGEGFKECGLSSYGIVPKWFPLKAFTAALQIHFHGKTFIGGQTYTDDATVDRSIAMYLRYIEQSGGPMALVPNYGLYKWRKRPGKKRQAVPKTPLELHHHLSEFIDEAEPVYAMIGWAENFINQGQWAELARFSEWMRRGVCALPVG